MRIVTAGVMVALAVLAGGCLGSRSAGSSAAGTAAGVDGVGQAVGPATVVTLSWPTHALGRSRDATSVNRPGIANCRDLHTGNRWWTLRRRTLRCPSVAAAGTDCAALDTLVRALHHRRGGYCPCPLWLGPPDRIRGRYRGHRIHLQVSSVRSAACRGRCGWRSRRCSRPWRCKGPAGAG